MRVCHQKGFVVGSRKMRNRSQWHEVTTKTRNQDRQDESLAIMNFIAVCWQKVWLKTFRIQKLRTPPINVPFIIGRQFYRLAQERWSNCVFYKMHAIPHVNIWNTHTFAWEHSLIFSMGEMLVPVLACNFKPTEKHNWNVKTQKSFFEEKSWCNWAWAMRRKSCTNRNAMLPCERRQGNLADVAKRDVSDCCRNMETHLIVSRTNSVDSLICISGKVWRERIHGQALVVK